MGTLHCHCGQKIIWSWQPCYKSHSLQHSQLTSFPSISKASKSRVMRYCTGAMSCHTQFLLGGYSCGHSGLVKEPLSLEMNPPQAAAGIRWKSHCYAVLTAKPTSKDTYNRNLPAFSNSIVNPYHCQKHQSWLKT